MGAHDGGGLLAHGLRHALDLGVGLLDELGDGGGVALLLVAGVIGLVRHEAQVGLDRDARDTNANAVRCVDSLVHVTPYLRAARRPYLNIVHARAEATGENPKLGSRRYFSASAAAAAASRSLLAWMSRAMVPGMARPIFL